ncbi:hypothetical protein OIU78_014275 [Salix suchowensis]|nr:hypothetical protein OIU78_014275 [Salix suchowensis]
MMPRPVEFVARKQRETTIEPVWNNEFFLGQWRFWATSEVDESVFVDASPKKLKPYSENAVPVEEKNGKSLSDELLAFDTQLKYLQMPDLVGFVNNKATCLNGCLSEMGMEYSTAQLNMVKPWCGRSILRIFFHIKKWKGDGAREGSSSFPWL